MSAVGVVGMVSEGVQVEEGLPGGDHRGRSGDYNPSEVGKMKAESGKAKRRARKLKLHMGLY